MTPPLLILEPDDSPKNESELWAEVTPVKDITVGGNEFLDLNIRLESSDFSKWSEANEHRMWKIFADNGELLTAIIQKLKLVWDNSVQIDSLENVLVRVTGHNKKQLTLCVQTSTLQNILSAHGFLSKAILKRYPVPTANDIGELKTELYKDSSAMSIMLTVPKSNSSYGGFVLVQLVLTPEHLELENFFYDIQDKISAMRGPSPVNEARKRVHMMSNNQRTLAGRTMEWVRAVAMWAGSKEIKLHDAWTDTRKKTLEQSSDARFRRMKAPRSYYKPYSPAGRRAEPDRVRFKMRQKAGGYYSMWNFDKLKADDWYDYSVPVDKMTILRGSFVDLTL